ncbi:FAD-dependent oxidoreductase [Parasphingopyxis sp. CP4]|uniref:FAD-dependent oxidoreductase n=1 Tax=Parasphingopyxis sp. CP4 TaxID=2724527 RepID=UPI0015A0E484|nr:FAD-dependent oxidoreductase [Parasphingopyxis sp. CP4]
MAGLLFARAGVETLVLEKHADFLRDFRGDTVHPSTLELFDQLGLLDELLALPHDRVESISAQIAGQLVEIADFRRLKTVAPFIAMMPQWDLLNFISANAQRYPSFTLRTQAEAVGTITDDTDQVRGVKLADGSRIDADLVIAADGRGSVLRQSAQLPLERLGAPMDVFWLEIPKSGKGTAFGVFENNRILILIDRGTYWQCGFVFAKGEGERIKQRPFAEFQAMLIETAPVLAKGVETLSGWDSANLLSVSLDRLSTWHKPGLLAIGDAAHAMSPIGGVGINLAIQDAVAAANILAAPIANGDDPDPLLHKVQERRWKAVVKTQKLQKLVQDRMIEPMVSGRAAMRKPPLPLRLLNAIPSLRRFPAQIIGLGFARERIEAPDIHDLG